ncbi:MAG: UDP-N-acetylmuramate--L-alanine ligase [Armatimonadaceae bacterium]
MLKKETIPEQPRPLPEGPLYFVGIGGAGQSAIAYVLAQRGRPVSGADPGISATMQARLESVGITVYKQHNAEQVGQAAAVIATDAVNETNPEIQEARRREIPVFRRPEALGAILNAGRGIAIAGTHGKTTTSGMVASILLAAGLDPTILIGGDLPAIEGNARNGSGEIVLAESCEAYDGFLYLHPEIAVILNIEPDHLDYHGTAENVYASFARFIRQVRGGKVPGVREHRASCVVGCAEDETVSRLLEEWEKKELRHWAGDKHLNPVPIVQLYGLDPTIYPGWRGLVSLSARNIVHDAGGTQFECWWDTEGPLPVRLQVPGVHNVLNALAAISVAERLGIRSEDIVKGLESFTGTGRRFERIGELNGVLIVDDYAHHPTEIRATLAAARAAYPERRLVAIFQPHLYSRTRDFMDEFADSLTAADVVYLTDIYRAREEPIPGVSSETLAAKVRERKPDLTVHFVPEKNDLPEQLAQAVRPGDLVLTMGAGDIRAAGEKLYPILGGTEK